MLRRVRLAGLGLALSLPACGPDEQPSPARSGPPVVLAASWPLWSFAARLAAGQAQVECLLVPGQDPRTWRPDRAMLAAMAGADLLLLNGAGLEAWAERANLPRGRTVDTTAGLRDRLIEVEDAVAHTHGSGEVHRHEGTDPHTWLDPDLAVEQARAVAAGLARVLPAGAGPGLDARLAALIAELRGLAEVVDRIALGDGEILVATHPTWAYLARRRGLGVLDVELDPARALTEAQLDLLRRRFADRRPRAFLWETAPDPELAAGLERAFGARQVVCEPDLVRGEAEREVDTVARLRAGFEALRAALGD